MGSDLLAASQSTLNHTAGVGDEQLLEKNGYIFLDR